jgi:CDP-diglyceride synthetase
LTTVVGLYPIILETSFQAQFLIPMAISLAYGVMMGTLFILILFPALILTLNDAKRYFNKFVFGKNLAPEDVEVAVVQSRVTID